MIRGFSREDNSRLEYAKKTSLFSSIAGIGAGAMFKNPTLGRAVKLGGFFGGTFVTGYTRDLRATGNSDFSLKANILTGIGGVAAFSTANLAQRAAYAKIRPLLISKGSTSPAIEDAYVLMTEKFPQLKSFFSRDTLAIGAAIGTISFGHAVIKRAMIKYHQAVAKTRANSAHHVRADSGEGGSSHGQVHSSGTYGEMRESAIHSGVHMITHISDAVIRGVH